MVFLKAGDEGAVVAADPEWIGPFEPLALTAGDFGSMLAEAPERAAAVRAAGLFAVLVRAVIDEPRISVSSHTGPRRGGSQVDDCPPKPLRPSDRLHAHLPCLPPR